MKNRVALKVGSAVVVVCLWIVVLSCSSPRSTQPTPEAAKRFLKLRGYEFNDKAFLAAVAANDVSAVNGFLAAGIDRNVRDEASGATALISAASLDYLDVVDTLLRGGADANLRDNAGYNAILRALQEENDAIADLLLKQPLLDLNAQGSSGTTVLMSYVWREKAEEVEKLLARGANPKLPDADGDTALHGAAKAGNVKILRLLLDAGADPNAKNKVGGTALMWAGVYGHEEAAGLLLDKGAEPSLKDNDGMTAADWAVKNQKESLAQLLRDAEKKR